MKFDVNKALMGERLHEIRHLLTSGVALAPSLMMLDTGQTRRSARKAEKTTGPDRAAMAVNRKPTGVRFRTHGEVIETENGKFAVVVTWKLLNRQGSFPADIYHEGIITEDMVAPEYETRMLAEEVARTAEVELKTQLKAKIFDEG